MHLRPTRSFFFIHAKLCTLRRLIMIDRFLGMFQTLPPKGIARAASALGSLWYALDRRHRELAQSNIRLALGVPEKEARRIARENIIHLTRVFLETARLPQINADNYRDFVEIEGIEHLRKSLKLGRGAFTLSGHFGNWEWMAYCQPFVLPVRFNIVARPLKPLELNEMVRRLRERSGNRIIDKKNAATPILRALKRNEMVGVLLDQNANNETGVYAPFFGGVVPTHRATALLAIKTGAPVHPVFNWRMESGKYRTEVHPAIELPTEGPLAERVYQATALFNRSLEQQIRRFPSQWYWIHRRFRDYIPNPHTVHQDNAPA